MLMRKYASRCLTSSGTSGRQASISALLASIRFKGLVYPAVHPGCKASGNHAFCVCDLPRQYNKLYHKRRFKQYPHLSRIVAILLLIPFRMTIRHHRAASPVMSPVLARLIALYINVAVIRKLRWLRLIVPLVMCRTSFVFLCEVIITPLSFADSLRIKCHSLTAIAAPISTHNFEFR